MPLTIARPVFALHLVCLAGWASFAVAAPPAPAPGFRTGAYADTLGTAGLVCVTLQHLAALTSAAWKRSMSERGTHCTITESDKPMPGHESWKARCSSTTPGAGNAAAQLYQFTVHADAERVVIDSAMRNSDGQELMKTAFFGEYRSACASGTPPLDVRPYLDATHTADAAPTTPAQALARRAVAADLIRCGNVFNGLSLSVTKSRQEGMRTAAAAMIEAAVQLHPGDNDFHVQALKKSAPEVSAELVGASADKRFALYQSCSPYLEPGGIDKAVQASAAGTPPGR